MSIEFDNGWITIRERDGLAVVTIDAFPVSAADDLEAKETILALFDTVEASPHLNGVLHLCTPDAMSPSWYSEFMRRSRERGHLGETGEERGELTYAREENALRQIVTRVQRCDKLVVAGLRGAVAAPLFGVSLGCDIRFASEDTRIHVAHPELGVPPSAGLGFFLPRYVGLGMAVELILDASPIPAGRARELGLVTACLPDDGFEERAVELAVKMCHTGKGLAAGTKELLYPYREKELEHYLDTEFRVMQQALSTH